MEKPLMGIRKSPKQFWSLLTRGQRIISIFRQNFFSRPAFFLSLLINSLKIMTNGFIIRNAPIAVDYWHTKTKPHVRFFFLTHCHADHTSGLTKSWTSKIYCSPTTAKLAAHLFGLNPNLFVHMEIEETISIDYDDYQSGETRSFHVAALEADHCPGAVIFLFDGWFGRILCTGDFRYEYCSDKINLDVMQRVPIDLLYLDGTNWRNETDLLPRDAATEEIFKLIESRPSDEVVLLVTPQARLGKESLLIAISRRFRQKICVDSNRFCILQVLELDQYFTVDPNETRFRLVGGSSLWNVSHVVQLLLASNRAVFILVLTSLPSWTKSIANDAIGGRLKSLSSGIEVIPYSDHSSRGELEKFLEQLLPKKIIMTGCRGDSLTAEECRVFQSADIQTVTDAERRTIFKTAPIVESVASKTSHCDCIQAGDGNILPASVHEPSRHRVDLEANGEAFTITVVKDVFTDSQLVLAGNAMDMGMESHTKALDLDLEAAAGTKDRDVVIPSPSMVKYEDNLVFTDLEIDKYDLLTSLELGQNNV